MITSLAACAVGPNYRTPPPKKADFSAAEPETYVQESPVTQFWTVFGDATLSDLIARALRENKDLHIAVANLNQARALRQEALFDYAPTVTANAAQTAALSLVTPLAALWLEQIAWH